MPRIRTQTGARLPYATDCEASTSGTGVEHYALPLAYLNHHKLNFLFQGILGSSDPDERNDARKAHLGKRGWGCRARSDALRLREQLQSLDAQSLKASLLGLVRLGGIAAACAGALSPKGPGGCDHNRLERCCNCATSMPYLVVGAQTIRDRSTSAGKAWGASLIGVGIASTAFHASSGKWRTAGRRLDYWSIALSSSFMVRSVFPCLHPAATVASILATPFKPFAVSTANSIAMEAQYLARAIKNPKLRNAQMLHASTCLVGLACFTAEEIWPTLPLVHSAWHLLSCTAVATVNSLVADSEELERERRAQLQLTELA